MNCDKNQKCIGNIMKIFSSKRFYNKHLEFNTCANDPSKSKYADKNFAKKHQIV